MPYFSVYSSVSCLTSSVCFTARSIVCSFVFRKTTSRKVGEVALYMWMMACLEPATESTVRRMRSSRAGVRTYARHHEQKANRSSESSDLQPHIIRNLIVFDKPSHEAKIGVAGRRVCDFDFFHATTDQLLEKCGLLIDSHRTGKSLIPISEVCGQPDRGLCECP